MQTRMQVLNPSPSAVYNGMIQGTYRMATGEGILSLWRGMSSVVVGAGPAHAVYFATYEAVKHLMGGNRVGVHHPLAAGEKYIQAAALARVQNGWKADLRQPPAGPVLLSPATR